MIRTMSHPKLAEAMENIETTRRDVFLLVLKDSLLFACGVPGIPVFLNFLGCSSRDSPGNQRPSVLPHPHEWGHDKRLKRINFWTSVYSVCVTVLCPRERQRERERWMAYLSPTRLNIIIISISSSSENWSLDWMFSSASKNANHVWMRRHVR